ncbi:DUF3817 domain-containing protein [Nocardioides nitrophenolicus]|uniref:DUF3817 domain-containing protein n=1 Tax=Nocardioides nitrophenolicus TaxID=60489 RepID=UPI001958ED31|nr:DUF3817 domain-containing protein [Nocardioides nitrophenolicus]MBM7516072.1 integral membrane protein [Nocardioides nitrophenolicus]
MNTPTRLFRTVAIAEAVTWTGLLFGMFLKYGPAENEAGVRIFGMLHGVVFVAYVVTTVVVWVDRRWSAGRGLLALVAAVPPLATLPLEWWAIRRDWLGDTWRLPAGAGSSLPDRLVGWLLANPLRGLGVGLVAVAALTGVALVVGPPGS